MIRAYYIFRPDHWVGEPFPEGTLLRYLGDHFDKDTQLHTIAFEVMGVPPNQLDLPQIQFV
jgi:hypothetical protein